MAESLTTNLGLTIGQPDSDMFGDYTDVMDNNLLAIDIFAGNIFGRSGSFTIPVNGWANNSFTVVLAELGDNDAVICQPNGRTNKTVADMAGLVLESTNSTSVTFTVTSTPSAAIVINYFISRGKAE